MRASRSRATSGGISPPCTASCSADSVWERKSVGARSSCPAGTSIPSLTRRRTTPQSTTNLVMWPSTLTHTRGAARDRRALSGPCSRSSCRLVDDFELDPVRVVEESRVIALDVLRELLRRALDLHTLSEN